MNENRDLYQLAESLSHTGVLLCFNGSFSQSIIEELGSALRRYLELEQVQKSSNLDVFAVYIEIAQNVRNYSAKLLATQEPDAAIQAARSIVVIGKEDGHYVVRAGNAVKNEDVLPLEQRLQKITSLDRTGLKAYYKEQLRSANSSSSSAGLGLIDMARKATSPLAHAIRPIDSGYSFFSLHVTI